LSTVSLFSVVDDDASVRAATSKFLRSHGYTVQAYSSAEHFLQSGRLNDTSCVIADLQMPGMSGLELLTMMRAHGYGAPFIFITGFPDETTRARALQAGAICFLPKPFAGPTLINCLGVALEGGRREEDTWAEEKIRIVLEGLRRGSALPSSAAAMASTGATVEQAFMTQQILTNGTRSMAFEIVARGDDNAIVGGQPRHD
jgi:FixJ family two-component response regulator